MLRRSASKLATVRAALAAPHSGRAAAARSLRRAAPSAYRTLVRRSSSESVPDKRMRVAVRPEKPFPYASGLDLPKHAQISYVTDVEGNLNYFKSYVARSKLVHFTDASQTQLGLRDDRTFFVFGGDAFDKGPGDIRFARLMIDFKR
jgi:hypothetical protein